MARPPSIIDALELFGREVVGGAAFGLIAGYIAYRMLKHIDNYQIEVLITLATVMGGYLRLKILTCMLPAL